MKTITTRLLATVALSVVATPAAFAGEAFVNNTHRHTRGYSVTDLNIESNSYTEGSRQFTSQADKIFIDGAIGIESPERHGGRGLAPKVKRQSFAPSVQGIVFDKFAVHTASSEESGEETFGSETFVDGTIFTREDFNEKSHTTSAGVR